MSSNSQFKSATSNSFVDKDMVEMDKKMEVNKKEVENQEGAFADVIMTNALPNAPVQTTTPGIGEEQFDAFLNGEEDDSIVDDDDGAATIGYEVDEIDENDEVPQPPKPPGDNSIPPLDDKNDILTTQNETPGGGDN